MICDMVYTDWTGEEPTKELFAIPVTKDELHGYLVIKTNKSVDSGRDGFLKLIKEVLHENILGKTPVKMGDGMNVDVLVDDFKSWLNTKAAFKVSSEYKDTQFCVAFIQTKRPLPKILAVDAKNMLKISVEEISSSHPVTFKGYLEFKKNKRFFLYLKNGRYLLPEQKKRLFRGNLKEICIKQIDEINLRKFIIAVQLTENILEADKAVS